MKVEVENQPHCVATLKIEFDTAAKERDNLMLQREHRAAEAALAQ